MRLSRKSSWLLTCLFACMVVAAAAADESLQSAYAAILRGDYEAGQAVIGQLLHTGTPPEQIKRVNDWLDSYRNVVSSREQLRQQTFEWNIKEATEQLEKGKVYLALSFATQAAAYADDKPAFAASPLVQELRPKALAAAEQCARGERWTKALSYYYLLTRIDEDDEQVEALREGAERHARLELIYETAEDVERRIKDVDDELLVRAVKLIKDNYYNSPDFKKMAEGGLDNLVALCNTTKLYKGSDAAGEFDGVADPVAREYFLGKLEAQRQSLKSRVAYTDKDLLELYYTIEQENKRSIELPTGLLIIEFMEGAIDQLDDFTSIIWPADAVEFDKLMMGSFIGVGIQLGVDEVSGRLKVVTPLANSPALEKGIRPGDLIVAVDGESTKDWTTDKAVREITGPEGTQVTLTIHRVGQSEPIKFVLTRRPIELTTIRGVERIDAEHWNFMLDPSAGIAYIRLTNFNPGSYEELHRALEAARAQGMRGLILDVRHNNGGLLDVAVETVSTFVSKGQVVKTEGRREQEDTLAVTGKADFAALPLVLLVNGQSASASEILAGCLRDYDRALVLGERTFGKGSVQRVYGLDGRRGLFGTQKPKARLKLTTALYYLPNGESPHKAPHADKWGVDPDWMVELMPKEFSKVLEQQAKTFIIHNGDEPKEDVDQKAREQELTALKAEDEEDQSDDEDLLSETDIELLRSDPYEAPDIDPQLQTALLHLRVKLAANVPWPRELAQKTAEAAP
jgi:carboxyl-terminal processing protease